MAFTIATIGPKPPEAGSSVEPRVAACRDCVPTLSVTTRPRSRAAQFRSYSGHDQRPRSSARSLGLVVWRNGWSFGEAQAAEFRTLDARVGAVDAVSPRARARKSALPRFPDVLDVPRHVPHLPGGPLLRAAVDVPHRDADDLRPVGSERPAERALAVSRDEQIDHRDLVT